MESSSHPPQCPEQGVEANGSSTQLKYPEASLSQMESEGLDQNPSLEVSINPKEEKKPLPAPERNAPSLSPEEEEGMFRALKAIFEEAEEEESGDIRQLMASLELAEKEGAPGQHNIELLKGVNSKIHQLWKSKSSYMVRATEVLANGSRDPKWRLLYGTTGILDFYLRVVATHGVNNEILLHALRLIGNSCADTDENRQLVVDRNYTLPIMKLFDNPALVHVAIPVVYNICVDFEPAQAQVAMNGIAYALLRLLVNRSIEGNALLSFTYELIEMASDQEHGLDQAPDEFLSLIITLAIDPTVSSSSFASIVNSLASYLQKTQPQQLCILQGQVDQVLSIMPHSYEREASEANTPSNNGEALSTSRLKLIHTLSDLSGLSIYAREYPLSSSVTAMLISWLKSSRDHLQICACVMLGNLAREDAICESMVRDYQIHLFLIAILNSDAKGPVIHSVLAFLKNLAVAEKNRKPLGEAGLIQTLSRLWAAEVVPHVQFLAVSLTRQILISTVDNVSLLLEPLSPDPDSPANSRTYLSLMLSLFAKTDSAPTQTEVGRAVAAICRVVLRLKPDAEIAATTESLVQRLFSLHPDVARPIGAMITQSQWPVVRSEGWFALALMASNPTGCVAVDDCLQSTSVMEILQKTVERKISEPVDGESAETKTERAKHVGDRDNVLILLHGLLKHSPPTLTPARKQIFEDLLESVGQPHSQ